MKKIIKFLMLLIVGVCLNSICSFEAEAAVYQPVPLEKTKIGNFYFCSDVNDDIYIYTGKTKKTKVTTNQAYGGVTNGVYVYYASARWDNAKKTIYRYQISTKKRKQICKLTMTELIGVYKSEIFYVKQDSKTKKYNTYSYNMASKKSKLILKGVRAKAYGPCIYGRMENGKTSQALKVYDASVKKRTTVGADTLACKRIGLYVYYARVVKKAKEGYEVRVSRYNLKTRKNSYVGNKIIKCSKVYDLTENVISYKKYDGTYDYRKYI